MNRKERQDAILDDIKKNGELTINLSQIDGADEYDAYFAIGILNELYRQKKRMNIILNVTILNRKGGE